MKGDALAGVHRHPHTHPLVPAPHRQKATTSLGWRGHPRAEPGDQDGLGTHHAAQLRGAGSMAAVQHVPGPDSHGKGCFSLLLLPAPGDVPGGRHPSPGPALLLPAHVARMRPGQCRAPGRQRRRWSSAGNHVYQAHVMALCLSHLSASCQTLPWL